MNKEEIRKLSLYISRNICHYDFCENDLYEILEEYFKENPPEKSFPIGEMSVIECGVIHMGDKK